MNAPQQNANFGTWQSPITAEMIASKSISFSDIQIDNQKIYWIENRPYDNGASVIVCYHQDGAFLDVTTAQFKVATSVHGYGGGAFFVKENDLYFSNAKDGFLYHKNLQTSKVTALVGNSNSCFADFSVNESKQFLYCLRNHESSNHHFPVTEIVMISLIDQKVFEVCTGADFYSSPRVSPNGKHLAWLQWNNPNMPWDCNELWLADIEFNGALINKRKISSTNCEAFYQPTWSRDNILYVCSDRSGFWNLYSLNANHNKLTALFFIEADVGRAMWVLGTRCFDFLTDNKILFSYIEKGVWKTGIFNLETNQIVNVDNNLTCINSLAANNNLVCYLAGNPETPLSILVSNNNHLHLPKNIRQSLNINFDKAFISKPELIEFPTQDKSVGYAIFYPPQNPNYLPLLNNKTAPPLIVKVHGGPTANADVMFNSKVQFFTSRGYAYVEVNYRGSTGYGKDYREKLNGQWGIIDVQDCLDAALFLCKIGKADKNKLIISGGSSGGYTVLSALASEQQVFNCGSCTFGISDLLDMANNTHKFEAYYDQRLLGASPTKDKDVYVQRSPIHSAHKIKSPIIFFHGDRDVVVDISQTQKIAAALKQNNIYHEVYIFEDEGHGFKKSESIMTALIKELEFLNQCCL